MSTPDPLDQLKRLAELRDAGILTPEEFQAKKVDLLACIGRSVSAREVSEESGDAAAGVAPAVRPNACDRVLGETASPQALPLAEVADEGLFGRVTVDDIQGAREELQRCERSVQVFEQGQREAHRRLARVKFRLRYAALVAILRRIADKSALGRGGSALIGVTAMAGLSVVLVGANTMSATVLLWAALVELLIGSAVAVSLLFCPADDSVLRWERAAREEFDRVSRQREDDAREASAARQRLQQARTQYDRLSRILQSRQHRLYAADWRMLRGIPFEDFLKDVFEELGFVVETTKASGDQGVDLLLARGAARIAVQAKGYAESVGNSAVQEAHAGMAFYRCDRCAVVTNSTFTAAARDLAEKVQCRLIEGSQIPDLIRGNLEV